MRGPGAEIPARCDAVYSCGMADASSIRERYAAVGRDLNERARRLFGGAEARTAGYGGLTASSRATGLARSTIGRGLKDLDDPGSFVGKVRRPGSGRPTLASKDTTLLEDLHKLLEPATMGDPMRRCGGCRRAMRSWRRRCARLAAGSRTWTTPARLWARFGGRGAADQLWHRKIPRCLKTYTSCWSPRRWAIRCGRCGGCRRAMRSWRRRCAIAKAYAEHHGEVRTREHTDATRATRRRDLLPAVSACSSARVPQREHGELWHRKIPRCLKTYTSCWSPRRWAIRCGRCGGCRRAMRSWRRRCAIAKAYAEHHGEVRTREHTDATRATRRRDLLPAVSACSSARVPQREHGGSLT